MFSGSGLNRSLCNWGSYMSNITSATYMFLNTPCPFSNNDPMFHYSPAGPFCYDCCCRPTVPSITEGPFEVPLVPGAVANLPNGSIMAWSAQSRYQYGGGSGPMGTFVTMFDPVTKSSTVRKVIGTPLTAFTGLLALLYLSNGSLRSIILVAWCLSPPSETVSKTTTRSWKF